MRLKPPPSVDEALRYLEVNATMSWGIAEAAQMAPQLRQIAEAMAAVAALDIDDAVEPLFAEDIAQDPPEAGA